MTEYGGITRDGLFLLADNRFRNSKPYYEEHKEAIKSLVTVPMRRLAAIIGEDMVKIDPLMNLVPAKMVSRVRRDSRFTRDKTLYRENMWITFMRPKNERRFSPCAYFEITPRDYSAGIGFYDAEPELMRVFRSSLRENPREFSAAAAACEKVGAVPRVRKYKRGFGGSPQGLEEYYNCKKFFFVYASQNLDDLADGAIVKIIRKVFAGYVPLYRFLLGVSDRYYSKEE